ncbi:MAG: hypothetical protein U0872_01545 [Planctomycetaceae bacterium]
MKHVLFLAIAIVVLSAGTTHAARRQRTATYGQSGQGVFSRLMELERRKNERLREIFLRR